MSADGGRQPTLSDVAQRANVSKQTISRVINNKGEVSDATRQRVLEAIREIGYYPNTLARSLVTSKSVVIGLSVPNIDQPFFPQIARGVEDAAAGSGYSVFLCNASGSADRELHAIERLRGHRVAGVISFNSHLDDETIERAVGGLFPVVMINRELPNMRGTVIWPGYQSGAELATEHLIQLGRRTIVFLGMDPESNVDNDKVRGYRHALERAGIPFDPGLVFRTAGRLGRGFNDLINGGQQAIAEVRERGADIDAIFASNDLPAIGAMQYLMSQGVQVPEDVAIVGFGAANVSSIVSPGLSTVTMPLYEMGQTAFLALLDQISRKEHGLRLVQTSPELIVRQSSQMGVAESISKDGHGDALGSLERVAAGS